MSRSSDDEAQDRFAEEVSGLVFHERASKSFKGYEALGLKSYETWLKGVEDEGEGKRFRKAIARYFLDEGERYAAHLLRVAEA